MPTAAATAAVAAAEAAGNTVRTSVTFAAALVSVAGCGLGGDLHPGPAGDRLAPLRALEDAQRAAIDFAALPPASRALGSDPIAIAPAGGSFVGALRGLDVVVALDGAGRELARAAAPAQPSGLAVLADGSVVVSGRGAGALRRYAVPELAELETIELPGARAIADVAAGQGGELYAVDEVAGRLLARSPAGAWRELATCRGPARLAATDGVVVAACPLDRAAVVVTAAATVTAEHDGPLWSAAVARLGDGRYLAAFGGVEDHPLDRTGGGFGCVDSFVFLYAIDPATGAAERVADVNVSAAGAVTPKHLAVEPTATGARVRVAGYGGDRAATLTWTPGGAVTVDAEPALPGITAVARTPAATIAANPLLDAWIVDGRVVPVAPRALDDPELVLGEALYGTVLIAPGGRTDGAASRFTCEACHVDGYSDGRIHYTGRDDIHATTRAIRGVFNNRPHFSRALDRTTADMVHAEVRVANEGTGVDPWFAIAVADVPWLQELPGLPPVIEPLAVRRALMRFLAAYTHDPNPMAAGRAAFTDDERRGAELFRDTCERCHRARTIADDPRSAVAFTDWEPLVLSDRGPIVWGGAEYHLTGVEPYVHPDGSRAPSLRRLYRKRPYFTNGSAESADEILGRVRVDRAAGALWHDGAPAGAEPLPDADRRALHAFLQLL